MFDDPRWGDDPRERDDDSRDRDPLDPRDAFVDKLNLPRGFEREIVRDRDREYELRGSESRTLSIVGSFRVVSSRDLRDHDGRPLDSRKGDLRHLREQGLVRTISVDGHRDVAVVLTERGRDLLESHRRDRDGREAGSRGADSKSQQRFYAELKKPREVEHDMQIYRAYEREAQRLQERGARVERVVLDYELKREYQRFLQERNRGRADSDGRPDRIESEIADWARERELPYFDGHVHFPDARIEYIDRDGRLDHVDIEVVTLHYRGTHGAAACRSGFSTFCGSSARTGGSPFDPDYASEVLR
ncbi:MAG: hypothetical protein DMG02_08415 [Acidobacteria bacterium]|nr:MAG: hypothetical protein DMG02_08415 [Acidobacteriota bacterium]